MSLGEINIYYSIPVVPTLSWHEVRDYQEENCFIIMKFVFTPLINGNNENYTF